MLTQSLPLRFLLPAWSAQRLRLLAIPEQQRAAASYYGRDAIPTHQRRNLSHEAAPAHITRETNQTNEVHDDPAEGEGDGEGQREPSPPHRPTPQDEGNSFHSADSSLANSLERAEVPFQYLRARRVPIRNMPFEQRPKSRKPRRLKPADKLLLPDKCLSREAKIQAHLQDYDLRLLQAIKRLDSKKIMRILLEDSGETDNDGSSSTEMASPTTEEKLRLLEQITIKADQTKLTQNPPIVDSGTSKLGSENGTSLYNEIFPEEDHTQIDVSKQPSQLEKLPIFDLLDVWEKSAINEGGEERVEELVIHRKPEPPPRRGGQYSVLVLNCALHSLEESDFFRLSPKGTHIEGWTTGIVKVIPGRDSKTLAPLDYYFILFDNPWSAKAYLDNIFRQHQLAETSTRNQMSLGSIPLPPGFLKNGEDVQTVIRNFSLAPAHTKLSLRFIAQPYKPAMLRMLRDGGPAEIASKKRRVDNMVLFYTDHGRVSSIDIMEAIYHDGRKRNLMWKVVVGDKERPIITLGENENDDPESESMESTGISQAKRHVISFTDKYEARRFVREWHRRPFPAPRMTARNTNKHEPAPIINAEILW